MPDLSEFLRSSVTGNPSTKRLVVYRASMVLLAVLSLIGAACSWWIYRHGDLGSGAVAALTFVAGIAAALAGVAYRKPDVGVEAPPARDGITQPKGTSGAASGCVGAVDPGTNQEVTP